MRPLQLFSALAVSLAATACFAQSTPPAYTAVRWNEDYSYLKDAAKRTDYLDPVKYIPLNADGDFYLSLGGQARYRYEYYNNSTFGSGTQDEDGYHLIRLLAHADLHLGEHFRFFVQGKSAMIEDGGIGANGSPRGTDADEADVEQAFADFMLPVDASKFTLRAGRQEIAYGAQRVVGPSDWSNARRAFDGAKLMMATGKNALDLFWVRPVDIEKEEFNNGDSNTSFAGIYDTLQLEGLLKDGDGSKLEMYGFALNTTAGRFAQNGGNATDEDRYTVGARFTTKPSPFDFDVEGAYQFGQFNGGNISAWMFATEDGYTFANVQLKPRLFIGFDIASGDHDPNDSDLQTYNQLFPTSHAFFGYIDVVGRQNIIDLHPGLDLLLLENSNYAKKLTLRSEYHLFWREDTADALYATNAGAAASPSTAGISRNASGSDESYVGSELDFLVTWQFDRHVSGYIGYSHFFAGDFINETAGTGGFDRDIDFAYAAVMFTF